MYEKFTLAKEAKANKRCWRDSPGLRQSASMVIVAVALSHANPNAKSHSNDAAKRPPVATWRLSCLPGWAGPLSTPHQHALHPVLGPQLCLRWRLAALAGFSLVWSFVVCFLAGGAPAPSVEPPD